MGTACTDWEQRLKRGESIIPDPLFVRPADRALEVFKSLRIPDMAGKPTFGEVSPQWVFDFVRAVFGGYDEQTGEQLIKSYFLCLSKKNSKSILASGVMLTMLLLNWRENEEHLIISPTKEIAGNSFGPASAMVRADEELSEILQVRDHIKTIEHRANGNTLKVVAADTDTVSGKRAGHIFIDELWVFGTRHNADSMLMEATGGLVARPEGWVIYATTQSDEPPAGVFRDKLEYFRQVRDGKIEDEESLPVIYEFPEAMIKDKSYLDPKNFGLTNPNLGYSVSQKWLETNLKQRQSGDEGPLIQFLAKHLNIEIGIDMRAGRWSGCDFWQQCATDMTLDTLIERSEVCVVGIDGGGLDDLLGLAVVGRDRDTGHWLHWGHAWAHEIVMVRRMDIAPRLKGFAKDGDLTIVKNPGDDVRSVAQTVARVREAGLLPAKNAIGVDQSGIGDIVDGLVSPDGGVDFNQIVGISQGWKLNAAIKTTERKLAGKEMLHCGAPLMAWSVGNAVQQPRGNAVMITKAFAGSAKIDPLMATFDAVSLMALNPAANNKRPTFFTL